MKHIISTQPKVVPGQHCGRWTVCGKAFRVRYYGLAKPTVRELVVAECKCGTIAAVAAKSLADGDSLSCGCLQREQAAKRMSAMFLEHGMSHTRLHDIWTHMIQRCGNQNNAAYKDYGGRGICVCEEWLEFVAFAKWATTNGYSEELTIDRIDNDKGYSPDNCRWTTQLVQSNNTRKNLFVTAFGETRTIKQWSRDPRCKVKYEGLRVRIKKFGWDAERAIASPKQGT